VQQAVHRETQEELGIAIELGPLVGVYSRPDSHIVLIVYAATTTGEPRTTEEASEVASFDRTAIPWDELAFWSTRAALSDFLDG
jgi:ADP-ribose pyrophosphatase YjhB (NUDIX family)